MDIARELAPVAARTFQSSRGGQYDLPASFLPSNAARIGAIAAFEDSQKRDVSAESALPGTVLLKSGQRLCDIHRIVICTGYHISYPFLRSLHADNVAPEDAGDTVLITDGTQTHNLHKDIFYIPDPTLSFIGVPYHVATFSLFEFQAVAVAAVFSGQVDLPPTALMRQGYLRRVSQKGSGRGFHSLKGEGEEIAYVKDLVDWINSSRRDGRVARGHSKAWHEAYRERLKRTERMKADTTKANLLATEATFLQQLQPCT
ncbi:hypothetical protein H2203_001921 [Taxawa tesnikishii (nom. ined.)]|nr:hypothetical protein H2203_001921 [Dothideales sp. JES 119]